MQQNITDFIVNPDVLNEFFSGFVNKSPFNLKKSIKAMMKDYLSISELDFYIYLTMEIKSAYKEAKQKNYIYHNGKYYKIAIIKFRMIDENSNSGKSKGWRVIGLVDELNNLFFLLDLYKHSLGKDDLTPNENKKVRLFCDEYVNNVEEN